MTKIRVEIQGFEKSGPCCRCGPPAKPDPKARIAVVHVGDSTKFNLCKSCYRDLYVGLPVACCAFGDCSHSEESPFRLGT